MNLAEPGRAVHEPSVDRREPGFSTRRGDAQRDAIIGATRELLKTKSFDEISVSEIAGRAGILRSGFYFYFDSKHAVLATLLQACINELDEMTDHFAARGPDESPASFVSRMVSSVATVTARNENVMSASHSARYTGDEVREVFDGLFDSVIAAVERVIADEVAAGTAWPIGTDVPALVRTLSAATQFIGTDDTPFVGAGCDRVRALRAVEQLWLHAFWGCAPNG